MIRWIAVPLLALLATPARADHFTVTMQQDGRVITETEAGEINLNGLTFYGSGYTFVANGSTYLDLYVGPITGPTSYPNTGWSGPTSWSGDFVDIVPTYPMLMVPYGYVSETPLSGSLASRPADYVRPIIPGDYVWAWGNGCQTDQCFELTVEQPPPGSPLFGGPGPVLGSALPGAVFAVMMAGLWARRTR